MSLGFLSNAYHQLLWCFQMRGWEGEGGGVVAIEFMIEISMEVLHSY